MIKAGGAYVEIVAKDNTGPGLASAKKNLEATAKAAKETGTGPGGGAAGSASLNTEAIKAQDMARRGAKIMLENRTAAEKYRDTLKDLRAHLAAGTINQIAFGRATAKAAEALNAANAAAGGAGAGSAGGFAAAAAKFGLGRSGIGGGELAGAAGIGLKGGIALASLAALSMAGSAGAAASIENLAPGRARELAGLGRGLDLRTAGALSAGDRSALMTQLAGERDRAEAAAKAFREQDARTIGGQKFFGARDIPFFGIGAAQTAKYEHINASAELLAKA